MLRLKKLSRLALRPTCMLPRPMLLTHRPARPLNTSSSDPYTVLGLERNCSENDLREAYLFLSRAHHPDNPKNKDDPNSAKQKFIAVQEAYRELLNHKQVMGKGFGDGQEHAIFYDTYTDQKIKYHFKTSAMTVKDITHEQVPDELSFAQLGLGLVFFARLFSRAFQS